MTTLNPDLLAAARALHGARYNRGATQWRQLQAEYPELAELATPSRDPRRDPRPPWLAALETWFDRRAEIAAQREHGVSAYGALALRRDARGGGSPKGYSPHGCWRDADRWYRRRGAQPDADQPEDDPDVNSTARELLLGNDAIGHVGELALWVREDPNPQVTITFDPRKPRLPILGAGKDDAAAWLATNKKALLHSATVVKPLIIEYCAACDWPLALEWPAPCEFDRPRCWFRDCFCHCNGCLTRLGKGSRYCDADCEAIVDNARDRYRRHRSGAAPRGEGHVGKMAYVFDMAARARQTKAELSRYRFDWTGIWAVPPLVEPPRHTLTQLSEKVWRIAPISGC